MSEESIASILAGSEPAPVASEPVEAKEPTTDVKEAAPSAVKAEPEKAEPVRDEKGKFTRKEDKAEPMVPLSALLAERAKRQEKSEPKAKPSFLENEDEAFDARASEKLDPLKESIFEISMEFARDRYEDFDEVAKAFADAAEQDHRLWDQMRESRNPGAYVYKIGSNIKELSDVGGDIRKYREKVTSETTQKLTALEKRNAELEAELGKYKSSQVDSLPKSLNKSTSSTPRAVEADDEDIASLTRFGKRA